MKPARVYTKLVRVYTMRPAPVASCDLNALRARHTARRLAARARLAPPSAVPRRAAPAADAPRLLLRDETCPLVRGEGRGVSTYYEGRGGGGGGGL